jgi:hypothetical protein
MNKEFCTYNQALALKELGFDEPCFGRYCIKTIFEEPTGEILLQNTDCKIYENRFLTKAPLYQQAFRWFREKYKLNSQIAFCEYSIESCNSWKYTFDNPTGQQYWDGEFNTYEEAELECLIRLIEMAKNK